MASKLKRSTSLGSEPKTNVKKIILQADNNTGFCSLTKEDKLISSALGCLTCDLDSAENNTRFCALDAFPAGDVQGGFTGKLSPCERQWKVVPLLLGKIGV